MIDDANLPRHNVLCLDIKSFFASVEAVRLGLNPMTVCLAVIGDKERSGSIVLAASPLMKKRYGIKTGSRLYQIPTNDPNVVIVEANMEKYLNASIEITTLLNRFAPMEAIHPYSIDELWICVDGTERLFGDRWEVAKKIRQAIYDTFGLPSCIGIGPNKFLAKVILDVEGKRWGIAECQYEDVQQKLWPQPIKKIWGIGRRMERKLNRLGITTLGDLAQTPLDFLKRRYGVMGEQLYAHAWGVDRSPVINGWNIDEQKGFGNGITLLRDYDGDDIPAVILDLAEEVCRRARSVGKAGRTVHLGVGYSKVEGGGGFNRSRSIDHPTNITLDVYHVCLVLFKEHYNGGTIRSVYVSLDNLSADDTLQLDLFNPGKEKQRAIGYVMDRIRAKHGPTALLRARSFTGAGIAIDRSKKIGGHRA